MRKNSLHLTIKTFRKGTSPIFILDDYVYHPDRIKPIILDKLKESSSGKVFLKFEIFKLGREQQKGLYIINEDTDLDKLFKSLSTNKLSLLFKVQRGLLY